ncbi:MAG: leucine-rich repeat protein [Clostridia bacterium]|nr:leucine-rich repeat protein [Clostridia bacterium]
MSLQSVDLPKVTFVGEGAFALCEALESVALTETLKEVSGYTFYGCTSLADIDFSHLVKIGEGAFCAVPLPEALSLDNVEYIDGYAFVETLNNNGVEFGMNNLVSVYAPKLTFIGDQAFASCKKLTSVTAPALESIGYGAFAYTAMEQFVIGDSLKDVDFNIFEGSESFKGLVNSEGLDTVVLKNVVLDKGVLYVKSDKGYILTTYPAAKEDPEYAVIEGTVRIEFGAALGNKYLEKVILPSTLKYIGNYAFQGCEKLKTVVFKSYYAPVLEGTMTGEEIKINFENVSDYTGFDSLYKYSFYYLTQSEVAAPYYYSTFIGVVGHKSAADLVAIHPDNCEGYDTLIYNAYFTFAEETSGVTAGKYAHAFIEAVNKLPTDVDRFDTLLVNAAITAYNALERHSEDMAFVDESVLTTFKNVRKTYNADVVEGKIAHLFDMDKLEYCFNKVKDAKKAYDALTAEEKELVTNASVLDAKIAALNELYGKTVDFGLSYAENVGVEEDTPIVDDNAEPPQGLQVWVIVLIVVGSVLVIGGAAAVTVVLMKKKKQNISVKEELPVSEKEESSDDNGNTVE